MRFVQPASTSIALNRVLGQDASAIMGSLTANGQVFLLNPNGVLFGKTAQVSTGGLVASTLGLSDADFMARRFNFSGTSTASVVNEGSITANPGGYVALMGNQVRNDGIITASLGKVALAAGSAVTLDLVGDGLISLAVTQGALRAAVGNSGSITASGGQVQMTAKSAGSLLDSVVNNTGIVEATSLTGVGGNIALTGDIVFQTGSLAANGTSGGNISIAADRLLQSGSISANGSVGNGGTINLAGNSALIQTVGAVTTADGAVNGGSITLTAKDGNLFTSAPISASGGTGSGGNIDVFAQTITLAAAKLNANGDSAGGNIRVGGDYQGKNPNVQNAQNVRVNASSSLSANARRNGNGGKVIVWSDGDNQFYGSTSATGGALGGNGGLIEVSAKQTLTYGGKADASAPQGTAGKLLLDPKNIIIDSLGANFASYELIDPHPTAAGLFGGTTLALSTGNVVVTARNDNFGGTQAGAVYLFNQTTGALISSLTGSTAFDRVGNLGITALTSGNYVINSGNWSNRKGAATWGSGTTGVSGAVSAANSLVGSAIGDAVGNAGITALTNGNYVVASSNWSDKQGAATWGNGATGIRGTISTANSLVGESADDQVGTGVTALSNGNYVVGSAFWSDNKGAATWGNGATGIRGDRKSVV